MLIGYARCSSLHQNLDRQIDALNKAGCEKTFQEKASGKDTTGRPELAKAIAALKKDDVLVVAEWDRATRSMMDGLKIIQQVAQAGAMLKVLDKKDFDLTTPIGRGILALLSALAEDERQRINSRADMGRKLAKQKGVKFGRKPKLSAEQIAFAREHMEEKSLAEIARILKVHLSTVSRALAK